MQNTKVIFIDWYKTLCSDLFLPELPGYNKSILDNFKNKLFVENKNVLFDWIRGKVSTPSLAEQFVNEKDIPELFGMLEYNYKHINYDHDKVVPLIKKLRSYGYKVVLATDNMDLFYNHTIPTLDIDNTFDDIISSHIVNYMKRDVKENKMMFFDKYLSDKKLKYSDVVLIDDNDHNAQACKQCGMNVIQISSTKEVVDVLESFLEK